MTVFTEFQAVVFAGGHGSRMTDITDNIPKSLLPVANIPMFWYALNTLQENYIYDVILITNDKCDERIRQMLSNGEVPPLPNLKIDIVNPGMQNDQWGTVEALRFVADKIKHDFIVMSGDIVSDIKLHRMLQQHRAENATLTVLLNETPVEDKKKKDIPGGDDKKKYRDFSILAADSNRLLFLAPEEDFEEMKPKHQLFVKFQNVHLTARYSNCHIYLMKRNLLTLLKSIDDILSLKDESKISSLTAEFIPYVLGLQYAKRDKSIMRLIFGDAEAHDEYSDNIGRHDKTTLQDDEVLCFAYKASVESATTLARCNTIERWFEANKSVLMTPKNFFNEEGIRMAGLSHERRIPGVDARSAVDEEAEIGGSVKIQGSVVMKGARIGNGSVVKNSIICPEAIIGEKCIVDLCIIGNEQNIADNSRIAKSVLKQEVEMSMDD